MTDLTARMQKILDEHDHGALGGRDLAETLADAAMTALSMAVVTVPARSVTTGTQAAHQEGARAEMSESSVVAALADALEAATRERDTALAVLERIREAVAGHPECDRYEEGDVISCGWKSAYASVLAALDGAPEPEDVWEYGYELIEPDDRNVFEREGDFISAAFAYRAARKRIHEERHPDVPSLQYAIIRRRKAGPWLPVEGECK